ncbi:MAG: DUF6037 family protein [Firmicutes bacterium]|nr:DUF6037 family protein [Bacillota bacterium]
MNIMGFEYSGVVSALKSLYESMRKLNVEIGTFEHKYNDVVSDAIFDTRNSSGWLLIFIKRGSGDLLQIPIKRGYRFSISGDDEYNAFKKYFEIGGRKGQFSIKDFIYNLDNQVPSNYILNDIKRKAILRYDNFDKESNGIFPIGTINWLVRHAMNPKLSKDKFHRSKENLLKTRELYPDIYKATKDMDISIKYGQYPGENTEKIKAGIFE